MDAVNSGRGHSAIVRMNLFVNGHTLPIAQLGPNFLVVNNPIDHPPSAAEIAMSIDGREERWPVQLHLGMRSGERKIAISKPSETNGSGV